MSFETQTPQSETHESFQKKATKVAVTIIGGTALAVSVGHGLKDSVDGPHFSGEATHTVQPGETYDTIANSIDGGASFTGATSEFIENHPENAEAASDGMLSPGEELVIPTKVEDE